MAGKEQPPGARVPLRERTTRDLLREAKAGDEEALNELFGRARGPLQRWARGRMPAWCRFGCDTDDLVNEALERSFKRLDSFEPFRDGALHAYLCRIVSNRILDEVQKARRRGIREQVSENELDRRASPEEQAVSSEAYERYEEALERLHPEPREAVRMRVDLQLSYEEIARALGKPTANAARMTVSRAIARLAREMGRGL